MNNHSKVLAALLLVIALVFTAVACAEEVTNQQVSGQVEVYVSYLRIRESVGGEPTGKSLTQGIYPVVAVQYNGYGEALWAQIDDPSNASHNGWIYIGKCDGIQYGCFPASKSNPSDDGGKMVVSKQKCYFYKKVSGKNTFKSTGKVIPVGTQVSTKKSKFFSKATVSNIVHDEGVTMTPVYYNGIWGYIFSSKCSSSPKKDSSSIKKGDNASGEFPFETTVLGNAICFNVNGKKTGGHLPNGTKIKVFNFCSIGGKAYARVKRQGDSTNYYIPTRYLHDNP